MDGDKFFHDKISFGKKSWISRRLALNKKRAGHAG
jgi:hypothetical protein